jgi:hypothetical protein
MIDKHMARGFDLYNPFDDSWVIDLKDGNAFHGSLQEIMSYMTKCLDFNYIEIYNGLGMMLDSGNNGVHFGMLRTPIYPFNKVVNLNEKAS